MDIVKVISALDSDSRREILKLLAEGPNNVIGIMQELKVKGFSVKARARPGFFLKIGGDLFCRFVK